MSRTTAISSGAITPGTTTVVSRKSYLNTITLTGDGTNAATAIVYDNTAGSGKQLANLRVGANGNTVHVNYNLGLRADIGMTVVVAGTGAVAILGYDAA